MNWKTIFAFACTATLAFSGLFSESLKLEKDSRIALIGNNLGSRMINYGLFETELHLRYPELDLYIRNMCDGGNTPGFRPHSARNGDKQWAFPGADKFNPRTTRGAGKGFNETPDQWLTRHKTDFVLAFFGAVKSFEGKAGLENFKAELDAFVKHSLAQKYNGVSAPGLALVSPIAFQDLSAKYDLPDGVRENENLSLYTEAMREVAQANGVLFIDLFTPTKQLFDSTEEELTIDGYQLNEAGYAKVSPLIADGAFGAASIQVEDYREAIRAAVMEKNWIWHNDFKVPNGVHAYGRRYKPFGPKNYPMEFQKLREMADIRDKAIWAANRGKKFDLVGADRKTIKLPEVETNFKGKTTYDDPSVGADNLEVPAGYKVEQFASEGDFPNLANPVQMSFDNKGRLWVATMPSYPHWRPGDPKPKDKLLIYEDTDGDGRADKEIVFTDDLTIPIGFELAPEGVYVTQGTNLILLKDEDNDDRADGMEVIFSGFDDHDTHHAISAFTVDPSGAIFMAEGVFLNTNVETAYGTIRGTNGGFFRFNPARRKLERTAQVSIPNPWGIAFDHWGQGFFLHTSGPSFCWMTPYRIQPQHGHNMGTKDLLTSNRVRPTSGLVFVSSRHFPDDVQGDVIYCNNIGFQGIKQHQMIDLGTGYTTAFRQDLLKSKDRNFRPVDLEFAPDGSLYVLDWQNVLIGHMQHNARDPNRDHTHGRIYRITYTGRPLVEPAKIDGASVETLLDNLKLPEYHTRYRTRRELRGRKAEDVLPVLKTWVSKLDANDANYDHQRLEALWVTWGLNKVDEELLASLLESSDYRVRAAAVNVLHYNPQLSSQKELLLKAASDANGRVRIETVSAASWLGKDDGLEVLEALKNSETPLDADLPNPYVVYGKDGVYSLANHPKIAGKKIRQVKVRRGGRTPLQLKEIEVISGGQNVAAQAKAHSSSTAKPELSPANINDGKRDTFALTADGKRHPHYRLEFEKAVTIDEVRVVTKDEKEGSLHNALLTIYEEGKDPFALEVRLQHAPKAKGKSNFNGWLKPSFDTAMNTLNNAPAQEKPAEKVDTHLKGKERELYIKGKEIYARDGHCSTCHQPDGNGLTAAGFPPLAETKWVLGSEERLIRLSLKGLMGPIEVLGKKYPGQVPMTPFEGLLNDEEMAAVLTYVRNSFGNKASAVKPETVKAVRAKIKDKAGFYSPEELLKEFPHE